MKTYIYLILLLILLAQNSKVVAQTTGKSFELKSTVNTSSEYKARDYIKLLPGDNGAIGFSFKADGTSTFKGYIDEFMTVPNVPISTDAVTTLINRTNDNSKLDKNLVVGTTAGSAGVSQTGGATYTIPITVPPGTAGMAPSLALSYNSQGGNGLLGMGWNLGGLSAITACASNLLVDGKIEFDYWNGKFKWNLDGQRLINVNGDYNVQGTEYRTEVESFSKIKQQNGAFTVWTKDGQILEYGTTDDSRLLINNAPYTYLLKKVTDINGNTIEYTYINDVDGSRISTIQYKGSNNSVLNIIKFRYEKDRTDKIVRYFQGTEIVQNDLLTNVMVYSGDTKVREYQLNYTADVVVSHLIEVIEYGADRTRYNSTIVEWGAKKNITFQTSEFSYGTGQHKYFGDFNGDGKTDIAVAPKKDKKYEAEDYLETYSSKWTRQSPDKQWTGGFDNTGNTRLKLETPKYTSGLAPFYLGNIGTLDVDANGLDEYLLCTSLGKFTITANGDTTYQSTLYGYSSYNKNFSIASNSTLINIADSKNKVLPGDYNGDGKIEFLLKIGGNITTTIKTVEEKEVTEGDPVWKISTEYVYAGDKYGYPIYKNVFSCGENDSIYLADFNGDGKTDMLVVSNEGYDLYSFTNQILADRLPGTLNEYGYFEYFYNNKIASGKEFNNKTRVFLGDFNGDGKIDVFTKNACYLFGDTKFYGGFALNWDGKDENIHVGNFVSTDHSSMLLYLTDGKISKWCILDYDPITLIRNYGTFDIPKTNDIDFGDFNGDGLTDIYANDIVYLNEGSLQSNRVQSVTNGLNAKTRFEYKLLTDNSVYTKETNDEEIEKLIHYPLTKNCSPLQVVSSVYTDNGIGGLTQTDYWYQGAVIHNGGHGFLGFVRTIKTSTEKVNDETRTVRTSTKQEPNTTYYFLTPKEEMNSVNGNWSLATVITYTNKIIPYGNHIYFPYHQSITNVDGLLGTKTVTTTTYSQESGCIFSHPTNILTSVYDGIDNNAALVTKTETVNSYYDTDNSIWLVGAMNFSKVTKTMLSEDPYTETITYNPLNEKGQLTSKTSSTGITTAYGYDDFGNLNLITTTAKDVALSRKNATDYQALDGKLIVKKTDALEHSSTAIYDSSFGVPLSETSANNQTVYHTYDGFGNLIYTKNADESTQTSSLKWIAEYEPDSPPNSLYYSLTTSSSLPNNINKVYYDKLGRPLRTVTTGFGGKKLYSDTQYNNLGQTSLTTGTYFANETIEEDKQRVDYTYDFYERLATKIGFGNYALNEKYEYDARTTTYTDLISGQINTKTTDALGNLAKVADPGGEITYLYNSQGLVKEVNSPSGKVTMEYDVLGNRTLLKDIDAGTTNSLYNCFSELTTQTDAQNNTYIMTYDRLGRMKTREGKDGKTEWFYDIPNGIGLLGSVTSPNNSISYEYDKFSRLINESETIKGKTTPYVHSYTYDKNGRLDKTTYPSGLVTQQVYNQYGYCYRIQQDNGTMLWFADVNTVDNQQRITLFAQGNSLVTTLSYNDFGNIHTKKITKGTSTLYNTTNIYNGRGQLTTRYNGTLQEDFEYNQTGKEYDNLNRLWNSTAYLNGLEKSSVGVTYDDAGMGNIKSKTDAGTEYTYDPTKVHAVTQIKNQTTNISEKTQDITYTPFNKVETITENESVATFKYGDDQERVSMTLTTKDGKLVKTKYYLKDYEEIETPDGKTRKLTYIDGANAVFETYSDVASGKMYYLHTDYLGSIELISDANGICKKYSFDAWGRRRNPDNWSYDLTGQPNLYFDRGFTGHEHLPEFALINMNGRMYDPVVGRFLSPDNYVQAPDNTQSFNRYSYCLNNPLKYTDPTGWDWYTPWFSDEQVYFDDSDFHFGYSRNDLGYRITYSRDAIIRTTRNPSLLTKISDVVKDISDMANPVMVTYNYALNFTDYGYYLLYGKNMSGKTPSGFQANMQLANIVLPLIIPEESAIEKTIVKTVGEEALENGINKAANLIDNAANKAVNYVSEKTIDFLRKS